MFRKGENKMSRGKLVFTMLYLLLSVVGIFNILIWGGYIKVGEVTDLESIVTLFLIAGTTMTTASMVFFYVYSPSEKKVHS